eukprot:5889433-Pyramimonas_sp.AAC.1
MLQFSDLRTMKAWRVSDELVYFLDGVSVPKGCEKSWACVMHALCNASGEAPVGDDISECAPFVLATSDVAADPS